MCPAERTLRQEKVNLIRVAREMRSNHESVAKPHHRVSHEKAHFCLLRWAQSWAGLTAKITLLRFFDLCCEDITAESLCLNMREPTKALTIVRRY